MANVVRDPRQHPDAIIPDFSKPDPLLTFTKDDVALVYSSVVPFENVATTSPLPQNLGGASVLMGGVLTSLLYANNGQLVGIVPQGVQVNSSQQIVPERDNTVGVPSPATFAATHGVGLRPLSIMPSM